MLGDKVTVASEGADDGTSVGMVDAGDCDGCTDGSVSVG